MNGRFSPRDGKPLPTRVGGTGHAWQLTPEEKLAEAQREARAEREKARSARAEADAYEWALRLGVNHLLNSHDSDLGLAKFLNAVLRSQDADPKFLKHLKGEK